jgi:CBS domain-containing protein
MKNHKHSNQSLTPAPLGKGRGQTESSGKSASSSRVTYIDVLESVSGFAQEAAITLAACLFRGQWLVRALAAGMRRVVTGREYELDQLAVYTVGEAMTSQVATVSLSLPLWRFVDLVCATGKSGRHRAYPVIDEADRLVAMMTRSDLPELPLLNELGWLVVADVISCRPVIVALPDESLRAAAERMLAAGVSRLPVVMPEHPDRLVGLLSRGDILRALIRGAGEHGRGRAQASWRRGKAA